MNQLEEYKCRALIRAARQVLSVLSNTAYASNHAMHIAGPNLHEAAEEMESAIQPNTYRTKPPIPNNYE